MFSNISKSYSILLSLAKELPGKLWVLSYFFCFVFVSCIPVFANPLHTIYGQTVDRERGRIIIIWKQISQTDDRGYLETKKTMKADLPSVSNAATEVWNGAAVWRTKRRKEKKSCQWKFNAESAPTAERNGITLLPCYALTFFSSWHLWRQSINCLWKHVFESGYGAFRGVDSFIWRWITLSRLACFLALVSSKLSLREWFARVTVVLYAGSIVWWLFIYLVIFILFIRAVWPSGERTGLGVKKLRVLQA